MNGQSESKSQKKGGQRSRTGCQYCRTRKIKCDEQYPTCGECTRAGRKCDTTTPIFRQHRASFAEPITSRSPRRRAPLARSASATPTSGTTNESAWVEIPSELVFVTDNGLGDGPIHEQQQHRDNQEGEEPLRMHPVVTPDSTVASSIDSSQHFPRSTIESGITLREHRGSSVSHAESPTMLRHSDTSSYQQHRGSISSSQAVSRDYQSSETADYFVSEEENRETSFLLRHFSETPGNWMDLFDLDCYYSRQVPVLARHNKLVKYAACAFAGKQLGQLSGRRSVRGGVANTLSTMETFGANDGTDYKIYGMKYYDKSISLLMEYISEGKHAQKDDYNKRYNDEIIVAATILSCYEFLSATTPAWSGHLDGTQHLLRLTNQEILFQFVPLPRGSPIPQRPPTPPKALKAAFWNFARQDFLASIITRKQTRLNVLDLDMWRAMGLVLDERGLVSPSHSPDTSDLPPMRDDMISNALVWLICKISNFIASHFQEGSGLDQSCSTADSSNDKDVQVTTWQTLNREITVWYEGLPPTFQPSARIQLHDSASSNLRWETWYSNSMCASTMQSYHMARMLLLIHRPAQIPLGSSSSSSCPTGIADMHQQDLLSAYRSMQAELRRHAIEICSIAKGRPNDSARVHSLQPLYFAGRCLTDPKDQETVVELLRGIEKDLGWVAEYRVEQLIQEWEL